MATLAESFLADLEDLSDVEEDEQAAQPGGDDDDDQEASCLWAGWGSSSVATSAAAHRPPLTSSPTPPPLQMEGDDVDALDHDNLDAVATLTRSERYRSIMEAVRAASAEDDAADAGTAPAPVAWAGASEEDPTYK